MNKIWSWFCLFCSTSGFTGFLGRDGRGGGTYGSLVGLAIAAAMLWRGDSWATVVALVAALWALGQVVIGPAEAFMRSWGRRRKRHDGTLTDHDFNETNLDEVIGQLVAALPVFVVDLPVAWRLALLVAVFVLFRVFDAYKPGSVGWTEKRFAGTGAFGIIIDDVVAGLMAGVITAVFVMIAEVVLTCMIAVSMLSH